MWFLLYKQAVRALGNETKINKNNNKGVGDGNNDNNNLLRDIESDNDNNICDNDGDKTEIGDNTDEEMEMEIGDNYEESDEAYFDAYGGSILYQLLTEPQTTEHNQQLRKREYQTYLRFTNLAVVIMVKL